MNVSRQYKKRKAQPKKINPRYKRQYIKTPVANVAKIPLQLSGFPMYGRKKVTLSYSDYFSLSVGAVGAANHYVFSANGMFDPNITGAGHQPLGFDQLTNIFRRYTVINSQIRVVAVTPSGTANSCQFGVTLTRSNALLSRLQYIESHSSWDIIGGDTNGNMQPRTVMLSATPATFFGTSKPLSENDIAGSSSANPTQQLYFHVWCSDAANGSSGTVLFNVEIAYVAIFHDPEQMPSS